jgi:hypothetical protein
MPADVGISGRLVTSFLFLRYRLQSFKVGAGYPTSTWNDDNHLIVEPNCGFLLTFGANMGEVVRFVRKSERERARLIREARAIYDSIFPPADPVNEQQDNARVSDTVSGANAHRSDGAPLP